jgi:hypothetical protein
MPNFSFKDPPFKDGDVIEGGNYTQLVPHTLICEGVKNLTINGGNFVNCKPQPGWILNGGNWCQVEYCSHERPDLIIEGLDLCVENCKHRSAEKVERDVDEAEYRKKKLEAKDAELPITDGDLSVEKAADVDGVTVQVFKVSEYEYKSPLVSTGGRIRKRLHDYSEVVK